MRPALHIAPLLTLPAGIGELRIEAAGEGFRFVDKLITEWHSGTNRFAEAGEIFLGAFRADELIAVGGLNHDPYADQSRIGRLRHLYVRKSERRSGVGSILVRQLLAQAEGIFQSVHLRTGTQEAAAFYVGLGFCPVQDKTATHVMSLRQS
jgi:GNAT superfamily N-acetyltransferase